jgi:HAD superfamily hydrolase (TIGR01662 family)
MTAAVTEVTVVIPTIGRPSLRALLGSLAESGRRTGLPVPVIYVVDDRRSDDDAALPVGDGELPVVEVLRSGGRGPAAARNVGWRRATAPWVAFLDDDVLVSATWLRDLADDLAAAEPSVAGSQGRITVPLPPSRRPNDWERGTAGLQTARWITADMAYRRGALLLTGGFDERFPRAFREDADLALRMLDNGFDLISGRRRTIHPVRPSRWWASVSQQRGNADDPLMRRLHGPTWRQRAAAPLGRRPQHLATTALAMLTIGATVANRRRTAGAAALGWLVSTAEFAWQRIAPGPRDIAEVVKMLATSVAIPPVACWFWVAGVLEHRGAQPLPPGAAADLPAAVLVDRDGTIVRDVPYNGDPDLVVPMPGARQALSRVRQAGIPIVVISNQSGVGRGFISAASVTAVNERIEKILGPFDAWLVCPHVDADRCACRKPQPGLIHQAAERLGVRADQCVVIGDIGSDMAAAQAAGASCILVPTAATLPSEIDAAPMTAGTLEHAVDAVLAGAWSG